MDDGTAALLVTDGEGLFEWKADLTLISPEWLGSRGSLSQG